MQHKLGLVLEGGASRTLFSCGVMDALLDEKIYADFVIGASAGISQAVSYVSKQRGRNARIAKEYMGDKRYMGFYHLFEKKNKSLYNMNFVFDVIPNKLIPFDYETYKASNAEVLAVVTNVETGRAEYTDAYGGDKRWTALRASCALPILFPMIKLGAGKYYDGGISDSIPYKKALESCEKVIVVTTQPRDYRKKPDATTRLVAAGLRKKYPALSRTMENRYLRYNEQKEELHKLEAEGRIFLIEPSSVMGVGRTEHQAVKLMPLYRHGEKAAKLIMPALIQYLKE